MSNKFSLFGRRKADVADALPPLSPGAFPIACWMGGDPRLSDSRALAAGRSPHAPDLLDPRASGTARASADLERPVVGHTLVHLTNEGLRRPIMVVGKAGSGVTTTLIRLAARAAEEPQRTVIYLDGAGDARTAALLGAVLGAAGRTMQAWTSAAGARLNLFGTTDALLLRRIREALVDLPLLHADHGSLVELLLHTVIQMPPGLPRDVDDLLARIDMVLDQVSSRDVDSGSVTAALVAREMATHVRYTATTDVEPDEEEEEDRAQAHEEAWRTRRRVLGWAVRMLDPDLIVTVRQALADRLGAISSALGADGWDMITADTAYLALPPATTDVGMAQRRVLVESLLAELLRRNTALPVTIVCDNVDFAPLLVRHTDSDTPASGSALASGASPCLADRLHALDVLHTRGIDVALSATSAIHLGALCEQACEIGAGALGIVLACDAPEPLLEALGKERPVTDAAIEVAVGGQSARTALREVMDTETRWRVRAQRALGLTSGECFLLVDGVIVEGHMTPVRVPDALLAVPLPAYPAHVPQTAPALAVADEVLV